MNLKGVILIVILLFITEFYMISNASRSGGSRGGGSRSGGSKSGGSRSGGSRSSIFSSRSSGRKTASYRYSSWTQRHGYSPNFRYSTTSYNYKKIGIISGLIIISDHQRSRFDVDRISSYAGISICYNEFDLYDRNTTQSPWFVCPWNDSIASYCCGHQYEEYCCRYFDRRGHLAGLIVGTIILILVLSTSYKYFCNCIRSCRNLTAKIGSKPTKPDNDNLECNSLVATGYPSVPECPLYTTQIDISSLYPPPVPITENYNKYSLDPIIPSYPADNFLPYPVSPICFKESVNANEDHSLQPSATYSSPSNDVSLEYPLIQDEKPPPSYSDVMRT